ncbi:MAG TPA: DUF4157 domain-containing protein [Pseudonocardiaceae bacterium]|jgi:hypothetical protein
MAKHSKEIRRTRRVEVDDVLRDQGQPLDQQVRTEFEPRFQHDFSRVRVHTDPRAAASAQAIGARAYTVGTHVAFGPGSYAPDTADGKRALAHELAHVVQQSRGGGTPASALETDAHHAADAALTGGEVTVHGAGTPALAKLDAPNPRELEVKATLAAAIEKLGGLSYRTDTTTVSQLAQEAADLLARSHRARPADFDPKQQLIRAIEALGGPSYSPEAMSEEDLRREWVRLSQESFARAAHPPPGQPVARQLSKAQADRIHQQEIERRQREYDLNRLTPYTDAMHALSLNAAGTTGFRLGPFGSIAFDLFLIAGDDPMTAQQKAANVDAVAAIAPAVTRGGATQNVGGFVGEPEGVSALEPPKAAEPVAEPEPAPAAAPPQEPASTPKPPQERAVWAMGAGERGMAIERAHAKLYARMGERRDMPRGMPGVDFTFGGTHTVHRDAHGKWIGETIEGATILQEKSIDLRGKGVQTAQGFARRVNASIEVVYQVNTESRKGITVTNPGDRILNVYYGPGNLTPAQEAGLPAIVKYAQDRGVAVNLVRH